MHSKVDNKKRDGFEAPDDGTWKIESLRNSIIIDFFFALKASSDAGELTALCE